MSMAQDFKAFVMRGNVVDLAVGVIIGAAFGKIVSSMVDDVLMPPIGKLLGQVNFTDLFFDLGSKGPFPSLDAAKKAGEPTLNYGVFLNTVINFLIVAFCIFIVVKAMNKLWKKPEAAPAGPTEDQKLLMEIRDLLKAKS